MFSLAPWERAVVRVIYLMNPYKESKVSFMMLYLLIVLLIFKRFILTSKIKM